MDKYIEKECGKHGLVSFVLEGRGYYRCTKCRSHQVQKRRTNLKKQAVEYKGGKCERCGYNKVITALEFHHLDPTKKDFGIAASGHTRSWEKTKEELDKCIMVCSNCHKEIHYYEGLEE
jgi:predicted SprT family Zn-dependent metalloprotease